LLRVLGVLVLVAGLFAVMVVLLWLAQTPGGAPMVGSLRSLFAINSVQVWWYITRAAGLTSYFLLWLSMVWGMAIPSKFFQSVLAGAFAYDFHEFLSLLGLGFVILHVIVLMFDHYLPLSIWQIVIPFTDSYRPLWVGFGIIAFYLFLLVTVTFYMRRTIGATAFRAIHWTSVLGYIGATLHGLFAGTDSALAASKSLYVGSFLIVFFLFTYFLVAAALNKRERARSPAQGKAVKRHSDGFRSS
jgi:predicted ferric reductase